MIYGKSYIVYVVYELFNKTAERAVAKRNADNATLLLFISSLKNNQTALNFDSLL